MDLENVFHDLRAHDEPVPRHRQLPSESEVAKCERLLGINFHADFRRYLLEASDINCGMLEPVTIDRADSHTHLLKIAHKAWENYGVPRELLPICMYNADFYCMNSIGQVVYWSHNGWASTVWPSLADWIQQVWLADPELL